MTTQTQTLTELPVHPTQGWRVDPETGTVYGAGGRWAGREIGRVGSHGYRVISIRGTAFLVHRVVWETCVGKIPAKLVINHKNGIKTDNRLTNLEVVTSSENNRHALAMGLHSKRGVSGPRNSNYRVTPAMRAEICERLARGEYSSTIAQHFGVSGATISKIKRGLR